MAVYNHKDTHKNASLNIYIFLPVNKSATDTWLISSSSPPVMFILLIISLSVMFIMLTPSVSVVFITSSEVDMSTSVSTSSCVKFKVGTNWSWPMDCKCVMFVLWTWEVFIKLSLWWSSMKGDPGHQIATTQSDRQQVCRKKPSRPAEFRLSFCCRYGNNLKIFSPQTTNDAVLFYFINIQPKIWIWCYPKIKNQNQKFLLQWHVVKSNVINCHRVWPYWNCI